MTIFEKKLLEILVNQKILTQQDINDVNANIDSQELSFEEYILRKFNVTLEQLLNAKSKSTRTESYTYDSSNPISKEILSLIPQEIAHQYRMIPISSSLSSSFSLVIFSCKLFSISSSAPRTSTCIPL